ncbi:hypothetical protein BD560DRAFT_419567 [Blakeslea trispora]|nr:hypothetical protein BD560DRAFT_419567 [Blakeslea trispora]
MSQPIVSYGQDEISHLRSQNDQLWKIIEKQRVMIQNLQKDNVRLSAERDGLQDQLGQLEREMTRKQRVTSLLISPQALREIAEADDASTPSSENTPSPVDSYQAFNGTISPSPMPPPRSPYRPLKEKADDLVFDLKKTNYNHGIEQRMEESDPYLANRLEDLNGRSSPGSPAPGPHSPTSPSRPHHSRKEINRSHSPFMAPQPSKSSSSLEVRSNRRQRDSIVPPVRSASEHETNVHIIPSSPPPTMPTSYSTNNTTNLMTTSNSASTINSITTQQKRHSQMFLNNSSLTDLHEIIQGEPEEEQEAEDMSIHEKPSLDSRNMANVCVKVVGSNIKPNDKGKEVISFIVSVGHYRDEDPNQFEERWRVEKLYSDFLGLDAKLKAQRNKAVSVRIGKLPDKALFSNNAPNKVDQRKAALEQYLQHAISLPLEDSSDLCDFLSTDMIDTKVFQPTGQKEGYLTKRGKNFGGWKTRYFVLNETVLDYFESKEGTHLGSIRLTNAQIGTQMQNGSPAAEESNSVYRHAFLIVEQKRIGSTHSVRHILCANSDDDRDSWVHALLQNICIVDDDFMITKKKRAEKPRKLSKGEIRAIAAQPISHMKSDQVGSPGLEKLTSVPQLGEDTSSEAIPPSLAQPQYNTWTSFESGRASLDQRSHTASSTLQPRPPIVRRSSMSNLMEPPQPSVENQLRRAVSPTIVSRPDDPSHDLLEPAEKKTRNKAHRMTLWGKKMLFNNNNDPNQDLHNLQPIPPKLVQSTSSNTSATPPNTTTTNNNNNTTTTTASGFRGFLSRSSNENDRQRNKQNNHANEDIPNMPNKQVFGVPLEEAVRISRVAEGYELPAVVYRCIEYLDAMDAVMEEGIYRLSGSNSSQKALRERFNQEGDVQLLAAKDDYDVHVVAGLLKMWLRELPTSVLTREYRMDFLHVIDLLDRKDRVNELGRLVSQLPLANYTLLRALTAHLIRVVQHADINKMTMRNVSIVFSPTLGIPATIFNLFMSEFEYIFWITKDGDAAPRMIEDDDDNHVNTAEASLMDNSGYTNPVITTTSANRTPSPPSFSNRGGGYQPDLNLSQDDLESISASLDRKTTLRLREEHGRNNRNSVNYMDGAPNAIVDLEKHMDGPPVLDEDEDDDVDDLALSNDSSFSLNV